MNKYRDRFGNFCSKADAIAPIGIRDHPFYSTWSNMIRRCENKNNPAYVDYGGRGITVCDEWHDSVVFIAWLDSHNYVAGLQIDRINNDMGYSPDNCHVVTRKQNCRNTRKNRRFEINDKPLAICEIEEQFNIKANTFRSRIRRGWPAQRAAMMPVRG